MLCIIDHQPKQLSDSQIKALQNLSNQVVKLFKLKKFNQLLKASQNKLEANATQMKALAHLASQNKLEANATQMIAFAHLALHDLKVPARMVNSFMKQLENSYFSQLDERAKKYLHFAADGASRMTVLIDELRAFSTTKALDKVKEEINVENLLTKVVALLTGAINEINTIV